MADTAGALSILVVDDESATRMMTRALLQRRGHSVAEAADGMAALAAVGSAETPFDVILLDVQMPGMDGTATLAAVRALDDPARAGAAVIMLTGRVDDRIEADLMALGADAVMLKPLQGAALDATLARCVSLAAGQDGPSTPLPQDILPPDALSPIERMLADLPFEKVRHLLERAAANLVEHRGAIQAAAAAGSRQEVERLAHKIAGVAGTYGCNALRTAAQALESEAIRTELPQLPDRVAALDGPFADGLALLERTSRGA